MPDLRLLVRVPGTGKRATQYKTFVVACPLELASLMKGGRGALVFGAELVPFTPEAGTVVESGGFAIRLLRTGDRKINVIKAIRNEFGIGLVAGKKAAENVGGYIARGIGGARAARFADDLRALGADVEVVEMGDA